jgi:hypothetical protein
MATMIPPRPADEKSGAEVQIFERLRDDPNTQGWIVLHSLGLARHVKNRYGEIDFVVLVPNSGVFCLEVKGGHVACREGQYFFGRNEVRGKSPFMQARDNMFSLQKIIGEECEDGTRLCELVFGFGVLFPHLTWPHSGTDYHAWQVYDQNFRAPISRFVQEMARRSPDGAQGRARPTSADIKKLQNFLRPDFECIVKPSVLAAQSECELRRLTEEQYEVLDGLSNNARMVIEGAAGTGKTLLAIEAARRKAQNGARVLLLCYNRLLGRWMQQAVAPFSHASNIRAGSFHEFLEEIISQGSCWHEFKQTRAAIAELPESERKKADNEFYKTDFPTYAFEALAEGVTQAFDVLIVDEGQDLIRPAYLDVFNELLRGGLAGGQWSIFGDFTRQAIYADGVSEDALRKQIEERAHFSSWHVNLNCRNTHTIAAETALLSGFDQLPFRASNVAGVAVDYKFWDSEKQERRKLIGVVHQLLDEGFVPHEITILSLKRREKSCVREKLENARVEICDIGDGGVLAPPEGVVAFCTVHAFKGLESRAVILIDVDKLADDYTRPLLYVAMSRPTSRLCVLLSEKVHDEYNTLAARRIQWQQTWGAFK